MRTLILIVFILFISFASRAQNAEWAPQGAVWYYSYMFGMYGPSAYLKMEPGTKDTILLGKPSRVLLRRPTGNPFTRRIYFYQDSGAVFIYDSNLQVFNKVYDFDADTSTSWIISMKWGNQGVDSFLVKPVYKGYATINGNSVRRDSVSFTRIGNSNWFHIHPVLEAIEFIGYTRTDLIPWRGGLDDGEYNGALRCYSDSFIGHYETGASPTCEAGIGDKDKPVTFRLYPNPATHTVTLEFEKRPLNPMSVSISDITGKEYFAGSVESFNQTISLDGLKPGIYMVRISSEEGTHTEKLLVR